MIFGFRVKLGVPCDWRLTVHDIQAEDIIGMNIKPDTP